MKAKYSTYGDAQLMELISHKDSAAFKEVYERHFDVLYAFAVRMLKGDQDQADDVVQEVFMKLYEKAESLKITTSLFSYLYQSVRNLVLDLNKHQQIRTSYLATFKDFYEKGQFVTDEMVREKELTRLIEEEVAALPTEMRKIFEMSRKAYLSNKEIAERSGLSEGTVKNQISYALKRMRSKLTCLFLFQLMICILWLNRNF